MPKIWRGMFLVDYEGNILNESKDDPGFINTWSLSVYEDQWKDRPEIDEDEMENGDWVQVVKVECIEEDDGTITNIR